MNSLLALINESCRFAFESIASLLQIVCVKLIVINEIKATDWLIFHNCLRL